MVLYFLPLVFPHLDPPSDCWTGQLAASSKVPLLAPLSIYLSMRQEKAMLHGDLSVRWKVASDFRFRAAISEPKTPSFCGISAPKFGSVNAEIASDCDCAILVR